MELYLISAVWRKDTGNSVRFRRPPALAREKNNEKKKKTSQDGGGQCGLVQERCRVSKAPLSVIQAKKKQNKKKAYKPNAPEGDASHSGSKRVRKSPRRLYCTYLSSPYPPVTLDATGSSRAGAKSCGQAGQM